MDARFAGPATPHDPDPAHRIALSAIVAAEAVIPPVFKATPQYRCEPLDAALGTAVTLKVETVNPIRCFKGRGASVLLASLTDAAPIVTASAGNWGQAVAYACRAAGRRAIVFASTLANPAKIDRMRGLGADVRLAGEDFDAAMIAAKAFAAEAGLRMVIDSLDVETGVGAATIAVELCANETVDAVVVPLGNGAMLTGIGRWVKAASPQTEVIGVCAAGADAMERSWREGRIVVSERVDTIADGIGVRVPVPEAVKDMTGTVDDVVLIDDETIRSAMRLLFRTAGQVTEPAGAAGVAAILADPARFRGRRVATVLCGGNVSEEEAVRMVCG